MVRIPEETVNDIRKNADIVDIVSQYVQLEKSGQNHFAHCPFHEDNTPSFSVNDQKQIFYCFSCNRGGNVFSFLKEIEGISYYDAILKTTDLINYPLDSNLKYQLRQQKEDNSPFQLLYEINKLAKKFYHHVLMNTNTGKPALEYLLSRGLTKETLTEFELGFSPSQRNGLYLYLKSNKDFEFNNETYINSGLFSKNGSPETKEFLDRFSNRIIFPIENEQGKTIGFSGRIYETKENNQSFVQAKYLNTAETQLFDKSKILYNFDKAKPNIRRNKEVILFEGFMDVISAWQAGIKNGTASMGTSLTESQIQLLSRHCDHIVLAFDGDDAGNEAIKRSIDYIINQTDFNTEVVTFPSGLDPDDYIQKNGKERFMEFLTHGRDTHMSFFMKYYKRGKNLSNETEQVTYIDEIINKLVTIDSLIEREIYLTQLSEEFNLSFDTLKMQFEKVLQNYQNKKIKNLKRIDQENRYRVPVKEITHSNKKKYDLVEQAERMLLNRLFYHEETWMFIDKHADNFQFNNEDYQLIYILFDSYRSENFDLTDTEGFLDYLQEEHLKKEVAEIFLINLGEPNENEIIDYLNVIQNISPLKEKLMRKEEKLKQAQRLGDISLQTELTIEIININKELKNKN